MLLCNVYDFISSDKCLLNSNAIPIKEYYYFIKIIGFSALLETANIFFNILQVEISY